MEVSVHGAHQMVDIVVRRLGGHIVDLADAVVGAHGDVVGPEENDVLDALLQRIGQLKALSVEDFDAVVLEGVV